jgi:hypothetical protein
LPQQGAKHPGPKFKKWVFKIHPLQFCAKKWVKANELKIKKFGVQNANPIFNPQNGQMPLNIKMGESFVPKVKINPKIQKSAKALW